MLEQSRDLHVQIVVQWFFHWLTCLKKPTKNSDAFNSFNSVRSEMEIIILTSSLGILCDVEL